MWTMRKKKCQELCVWSLIQVTYTRSCRISTLNDAHNTEKAHCLDVKFKPERQPTFTGDGDGGIVVKLLESTAHFSSLY